MSNDTYSGSSLSNLRPATPEDADGFNVDARALRQIKRFLKNSDGLLQTITDILTNKESTILDKFKRAQAYSKPNAVIALRSDINPNDSDKYIGRWERLNGVSICGTGNAGFTTFPFMDSESDSSFPIVEHNIVNFPRYSSNIAGSLYSRVYNSTVRILPTYGTGGTSAGAVFFMSEKAYIIFPIYPELNNKITVKIDVVGNGYTSIYGIERGWSCYSQSGPGVDGVPFTMWLSHDNQGNTKHYNHTGRLMLNNSSGIFTIEKAHYGNTPYLLLDFGDLSGGYYELYATYGNGDPYIDITVSGDGKKLSPDYNLTWVLTASQYSNCTLDPVIEKHSNRTYRLMLRVFRNQGTIATLNKIYFYTSIGNLNDLEAVSFSIKNAWSLLSGEYMSNWPCLALSDENFIPKYPNYRIKITLSKSPTYDPTGIVIGEITIEDYLKNGIYFNEIENTIKELASGYIVVSIISPNSIELTEDTTWWLGDVEITVNLKRAYNTDNYSTYNVELNKDYRSSLPLQGINFWKRIDDGTERNSNTD